jgi:hypothetical protein
MAVGFPVKDDYATGDVLTAANMNDFSGTLNTVPDTIGAYAAGKNKITNGNMVIDQRNTAGTAVTVNAASAFYSTDRWRGFGQATDGVFTLGQDSDAPSGFSKSLKVTVTTADASIGSTQQYSLQQRIEGNNVVDLELGTATAKTFTISFWVRSSLTGNMGGAINNSAFNRSYPFQYTINSANTWEKKSITILGDTTGTWLKDTGIGLILTFGLGAGSSVVSTANAWTGSNAVGVTGQVQVIGTLNATWYVTGVQLEAGSIATPFQTATGTIQGELAACQRYYWRLTGGATYAPYGTGYAKSTTAAELIIDHPVVMRVSPTSIDYLNLAVGDGVTGTTLTNLVITFANTGKSLLTGTVASGLTQYRPYALTNAGTTTAHLGLNAEL